MSGYIYQLRDVVTGLWVYFDGGKPYGTTDRRLAAFWESFDGADAVKDCLGREHGTETRVIEGKFESAEEEEP